MLVFYWPNPSLNRFYRLLLLYGLNNVLKIHPSQLYDFEPAVSSLDFQSRSIFYYKQFEIPEEKCWPDFILIKRTIFVFNLINILVRVPSPHELNEFLHQISVCDANRNELLVLSFLKGIYSIKSRNKSFSLYLAQPKLISELRIRFQRHFSLIILVKWVFMS